MRFPPGQKFAVLESFRLNQTNLHHGLLLLSVQVPIVQGLLFPQSIVTSSSSEVLLDDSSEPKSDLHIVIRT